MKVLKVILVGFVIFVIIKLAIIIIPELFKEEQYYYECIDTFGNSVICEKIYNSYGQLWGITEDGTEIPIAKGKKIITEDEK